MAIDDNVRELAWRLHGRQYRGEMARVEEQGARILGLVVAFGASDDLMEFRGAINDDGLPFGRPSRHSVTIGGPRSSIAGLPRNTTTGRR